MCTGIASPLRGGGRISGSGNSTVGGDAPAPPPTRKFPRIKSGAARLCRLARHLSFPPGRQLRCRAPAPTPQGGGEPLSHAISPHPHGKRGILTGGVEMPGDKVVERVGRINKGLLIYILSGTNLPIINDLATNTPLSDVLLASPLVKPWRLASLPCSRKIA